MAELKIPQNLQQSCSLRLYISFCAVGGGHTGTARGAQEKSRNSKKKKETAMATAFKWVSAFHKTAQIANFSKSFSFKPFTLHHLNKPNIDDPLYRKAPL